MLQLKYRMNAIHHPAEVILTQQPVSTLDVVFCRVLDVFSKFKRQHRELQLFWMEEIAISNITFDNFRS